jgi:hypothetical protein
MAYANIGNNYRSKRSYITTAPFNGSIFEYTTQLNSTNFKNEGKLTPIANAPSGTPLTAANCPAGTILRETGAHLYPGAHPGLTPGDTYNGVVFGTPATNHFWVKVFDSVTGVRGFIDPNGSIFTVYNSDKPLEIVDAGEQDGTKTRLSAPVYTAGSVTAGTTVAAGTTVTAGTTITAGGQIRSSTVTAITPGATASFNGTLGQVFTLAQASGQAMTINCGTVPPAGSIVYIVVTPAGTAALITWGTNIKGLNVTPTAAKVTTCSFVSDGTNLNQFGAITSS